MSYPVGPLLQAMAQRILANLKFIQESAPPSDSADFDEPPYADTQLLISLLGVLVFPHERTPGALSALVQGYDNINDIVRVRYSLSGPGRAEFTDVTGREEMIDASSLEELPRLLRNSIAHFNILPISNGNHFDGIRVWNTNNEGVITFVADIRFSDLRPFATHVLDKLAKGDDQLTLDDPEDPLQTVGNQQVPKRGGAPRIIDHVWDSFVSAHSGSYEGARSAINRLLADEAQKLHSIN